MTKSGPRMSMAKVVITGLRQPIASEANLRLIHMRQNEVLFHANNITSLIINKQKMEEPQTAVSSLLGGGVSGWKIIYS